MISVLTVTKRTGWEKIAYESLKRQTFRDFEWIIVTEEWPLHVDYPIDIPTKIFMAPKKTRVSNLSASDNEGLRHCSGEYVVFYQDFIILEDDCLEKLVKLATPKTWVTTLTRNPEGELEDTRYLWEDAPRKCAPQEWEENVGLAPLAIIRELGGYDEEYDDGWAWNNCNIAERAEILGCDFILDETNRPQLIHHKKEPELDPSLRINGDFHDKRMQDIHDGKFPLKLNYL